MSLHECSGQNRLLNVFIYHCLFIVLKQGLIGHCFGKELQRICSVSVLQCWHYMYIKLCSNFTWGSRILFTVQRTLTHWNISPDPPHVFSEGFLYTVMRHTVKFLVFLFEVCACIQILWSLSLPLTPNPWTSCVLGRCHVPSVSFLS